MAGSKYYSSPKIIPLGIIHREKKLLENHYDFINCHIKKSILYCIGIFKPTEFSIKYTYLIKYDGINKPSIYMINPKIEYNDNIHMYPKDNSLCLFHRSDMIWKQHHHLYKTIIPWTHEWIVFYELYNITGKWEHPEIRHGKLKE